MLKIWIFAIAVVPFVAPFPTNNGNEDAYRLNAGQHNFSISMLKMLERDFPGRNHIFSPHSTYRVLTQAYLSLDLPKDTAKSFNHSMHLGWAKNEEDFVNAFVAEATARANRVLGDGIEFESANKLYVSQGYSLKPHAMELFTNSIQRVDFSDPEPLRQEINAFVEKVTRQHFKELFAKGSITSETDLVVVNAAFFKGLWTNKFDKKNTKVEKFNGATPADVEMMNIKEEFSYGELEEENAAFLEMPYQTEDQSISMFVFLPRENSPTAVDNLLYKMSSKTINRASRGSYRTVNVKFPKMQLKSKYSLLNTLKAMGLKGSTFNGVIHKAKIDVDEEGSVAAAATGGCGITSYQPPVEFHCDHPFIFMINDRVTHEVLFAGVYRGPAAEAQ